MESIGIKSAFHNVCINYVFLFGRHGSGFGICFPDLSWYVIPANKHTFHIHHEPCFLICNTHFVGSVGKNFALLIFAYCMCQVSLEIKMMRGHVRKVRSS